MNIFSFLVKNLEGKVSASELDELFRKLFWDFEKITIVPIAWGFGGAGVVMVRPEKTIGSSRNEVVVKFGKKEIIEKEKDNFRKYVEGVLGGNRYTLISAFSKTSNLAGIVYSFVGGTTESLVRFDEYYKTSHIRNIENVVNNLFSSTCELCYNNKKMASMENLELFYRKFLNLKQEELEKSFNKHFKSTRGKNKDKKYVKFEEEQWLKFKGIEELLINPVYWLKKLNSKQRIRLFRYDTYFCINHGDMRGPNIFVDNQQHCWLIDFLLTQEGHILNDFAKLEVTVKFELLDYVNVETLNDLWIFEKNLLILDTFHDINKNNLLEIKSCSKEFLKAFHIIKKIREKAFQITNITNLNEYYVSLFFHSLKLCRSRVLPTYYKKTYALLSSALIAERLQAHLDAVE